MEMRLGWIKMHPAPFGKLFSLFLWDSTSTGGLPRNHPSESEPLQNEGFPLLMRAKIRVRKRGGEAVLGRARVQKNYGD